MSSRNWTNEEQLLALRLYCTLPFGQLHQGNKDVIAVAEAIGRTPSAVAMKACNFASLDPNIKQKGLGNVSQADRELWAAFMRDSEQVTLAAEDAYLSRVKPVGEEADQLLLPPAGDTETEHVVRVRLVQRFFRKSVLVSYGHKCAISGLAMPDLLIASHIIPWSVDEHRRADPTNGIALNALYDAAFDKGFMTFDDDYRVVLSQEISHKMNTDKPLRQFFDIQGRQLNLPSRFYPDNEALHYHQKHIFRGRNN